MRRVPSYLYRRTSPAVAVPPLLPCAALLLLGRLTAVGKGIPRKARYVNVKQASSRTSWGHMYAGLGLKFLNIASVKTTEVELRLSLFVWHYSVSVSWGRFAKSIHQLEEFVSLYGINGLERLITYTEDNMHEDKKTSVENVVHDFQTWINTEPQKERDE